MEHYISFGRIVDALSIFGIMNVMTMVVQKRSTIVGSVPVLIVGCFDEVEISEGRWLLKLGISKAVIGLTKPRAHT